MSYDFCGCDSYSYPYRDETRTARKQHKCGECGSKIMPGEKYLYATGLCEGDWFDARRCQRCLTLFEFVKAHVPCLCTSFGNMIEEIMECAQEAGREAPGLYFGAMRRLILARRHREKQSLPQGERSDG